MTNPQIAIDIVANDRSARGVGSAERRIGTLPKHAGIANRRMVADGERAFGRSSRTVLRTLGSVEQATAKVFGNRSLTSGLTARLGALGEAGSAAGSGLGQAAAAGGLLEGACASVGVVVASTVGVLAAAAYGAFKLADGWAKGAASIGRTAEIIGVGTKAMQEFSAAAERVGVDKDKATGGLGGLSQTLNDARYGRNTAALAVLAKLGVQMKLNEDGTVNVAAMLPAIADAVQRQNSSGRRTVAKNLGFGLDLLPVMSQGGKALAGDMKDADAHATVLTDAEIARGKRIQRKGAMVGQLTGRAMSKAGSWTAGQAEAGYDAVLSGGTKLTDAINHHFEPAAAKVDRGGAAVERGGRAIERAAGRMSAGRIPPGLNPGVIAAAQRTQRRTGIPASITLGQYGLESSFGRHMPAGSNNPFGIKARAGEPFVVARTREETRSGRSYYTEARFRKFGSLEEAFDAHAQLLRGKRYSAARSAGSVEGFADRLTGVYATDHRYGSKLKSLIHSNGLNRFDSGEAIPVKVEIDMRGAPAGTRTKVTAGKGKPAISHAVQYEGVHGG